MDKIKYERILKTLKEITNKQKCDTSEDSLLDCATRIYNNEIRIESQGNIPATESQKNYLKSMGIKFDKSLTKEEASKLISENKK